MKITTGIKLDEEMRKRLKTLGERKERTPHWLMKRAIQEYLDREEVFEREKQEDMGRWQTYVETGEYIPHKEMREKLIGLVSEAEKDLRPR